MKLLTEKVKKYSFKTWLTMDRMGLKALRWVKIRANMPTILSKKTNLFLSLTPSINTAALWIIRVPLFPGKLKRELYQRTGPFQPTTAHLSMALTRQLSRNESHETATDHATSVSSPPPPWIKPHTTPVCTKLPIPPTLITTKISMIGSRHSPGLKKMLI